MGKIVKHTIDFIRGFGVIALGLLKKLKKKLRWKRRWLTLAVLLLLAGISSVTIVLLQNKSVSSRLDGAPWSESGQSVLGRHIAAPAQPEAEVQAMFKQLDGAREAFAKKAYVCGEELQLLGTMTPEQMMQYHKEHPALTVVIGEKGDVFFTEQVDDLSPQCKTNAYFGLDENGNLSLFEGVPEGKQVIRTFFQLNVEFLESSLPRETVKQLYRGIPVSSLEEYNSVLSTFADFAVPDAEKWLK